MTKQDFYQDVQRFNEIYKLPTPDGPTLLPVDRIRNFQEILAEEVDEGADLAAKYEGLLAQAGGEAALDDEARLEVLGDMADWLGDVVVYCASEARRWGLPLERILQVIMESNFSKLDAQGLPIYDARGKVMKGPNYWKPEPKLRELLRPAVAGRAVPPAAAATP